LPNLYSLPGCNADVNLHQHPCRSLRLT